MWKRIIDEPGVRRGNQQSTHRADMSFTPSAALFIFMKSSGIETYDSVVGASVNLDWGRKTSLAFVSFLNVKHIHWGRMLLMMIIILL